VLSVVQLVAVDATIAVDILDSCTVQSAVLVVVV
jgi:hypothetical protein